MKKTKTIIITVLFAILITSLFGFSSFAIEPEISEEGLAQTQTESEKTFFDEIYDAFCAHSDKIFSVLAFAATLILSFCYKNGLLPILKAALTSISASIKKFEENSEKSSIEADASLKCVSDRFIECENAVKLLCESTNEMIERLSSAEDQQNEILRLKQIMKTEVELLYDVFMQSSLPQYSKDRVSEKVGLLNKLLGEEQSNE